MEKELTGSRENMERSLSATEEGLPKPEQQLAGEQIRHLLEQHGINSHVEVTLLLGPHSTAADIDLLKGAIEKCDIFVPELVGFNEREIELIEDISFGRLPASIANPYLYPSFLQLLANIENTHTVIAHADVKKDDEILEEMKRLDVELLNIYNIKDPDVAATSHADVLIKITELEKRREQQIALRLPQVILDQILKHQELRKKENIKVLMFMGAMHGSLRDDLKTVSGDVKTEYTIPYLIHDFAHELRRRYLHGKEIDYRLKLNALMELLFLQISAQGSVPIYKDKGYTDLSVLIRKHISMFSEGEIKEIWRLCAGKEVKEMTPILVRALAQKGIDTR